MSVIIKGIDKHPVSCFECPLINGSDECVFLDSDTNFIYDDLDLAQTEMCPIIGELPEKHGRLIDSDDFLHKMEQAMDDTYKKSENLYEKIMSLQIKIIISEVIKGCKAVIESEE